MAESYTLLSPDGRLKCEISTGDGLCYSVSLDGRQLISDSPISLTTGEGELLPSRRGKIRKVREIEVDEEVETPFYQTSTLRNHYHELTLRISRFWNIQFRAYDDGVAYRWTTTRTTPFTIQSEQVAYRFSEDWVTSTPYVQHRHDGDIEKQLFNSFENTYTTAPLSQMDPSRLSLLPLVVDAGEGYKICLTESDLESYPGLYLYNPAGEQGLQGYFARYPAREERGGHNDLQMMVTEREEYLARVEGPRTFPWRVAIVTRSDADLAASHLNYLLGAPNRIGSTEWIKPGKVAWEWWNDWNIRGVDFASGINTATYKHYIDFAAERGIEYVILDEGWSVHGAADLMQVVPEIDLKELVRYADERGVGIIIWAGYLAFERDMEAVCRHYAEMGIKGFKIDFMDRDDQPMVEFNHRAAATAARYRLVVDLHGMYKPGGFNRTYPNALNFEGVHGLEQMKWSPTTVDQVSYDVMVPFIRQVAGPIDYTQGAMRNATRNSYYPSYSEPMSQGTRARQLALYVVFFSPLNMLCDSPTNYRREAECCDMIASIPTTWDETRILAAEMGRYIVTARRKGNTWYVGGITDWTARDFLLDLRELDLDGGTITLFADGVNAERAASDYRCSTLDGSSPIAIRLASGGGFLARITR